MKPEIDFEELQEWLSYMHVAELKDELKALNLSTKAFNKKELIERLVHYAKTGKELPHKQIPEISKAKSKTTKLEPQSLILYGTYKNDLATRQFFKKIIGDHFHFTASGIDWLREKWLLGNPPTYAEFAKEWQTEYERNKIHKKAPKQEWAFIRFSQKFIKENPNTSKQELIEQWDKERLILIDKARKILRKK